MYIISNVNEFGKRQYTDIFDLKDVKDVLIGITDDEEFSKVMYSSVSGNEMEVNTCQN